MSCLEELALYVRILDGSTFISGTHLDNEIHIHMPQLHTFSFYFTSEHSITDPAIRLSSSDIERTFTHMEHRQVACMVDYFESIGMICRVFSLPFKFHRIQDIGNNIPDIVFNSVTYLKLQDNDAFKHVFFVRLARAFPFLKSLSIYNFLPPNWRFHEYHHYHIDWCSIVEYPHLIFLDINEVNSYYVGNFLNETKTYLPRLTELKIHYENLKIVTKNFTRDETRRNCAKVKRLVVRYVIVYPKEVYCYFPLLSL